MKLVVDIGGTKIRKALWDGNRLNEIESIPTPHASVNDFLNQLNQFLLPTVELHNISEVNISSAGPINIATGELLNPVNLSDGSEAWQKVNLNQSVLPDSTCKVQVDNDAAMAAWGQFCHFEESNIDDMVVMTLGTGIGVGAIVNGQLVRGGQGRHPEVGHLLMTDRQDSSFPTPFADFGSTESFLSGHYFSKRVGQALGQEMSGQQLIEKSQNEFETVKPFWDEYSRRMAVCFTNLYLIYYPRKIVLGGGFAEVAAPFFLEGSLEWMDKMLQKHLQGALEFPEVSISEDSSMLPLLGAAYR